MTCKTIFSGSLEFGSSRSFEKVLKMYQHRVENYYKNDILLKEEAIFSEESSSLCIPRQIVEQAENKSWKNTINLLKYTAQYAIAGSLSAWRVDQGKVLEHNIVEPEGDKTAIQAFREGRQLIKEEGKETEAKAALNRAIEKFERHALAYERRGFVNFQLRNYKDALYDYTKSIDINPRNAEPYLGRAFVHIHQEDWAKAVADLEYAIKQSIPLQPIYWKSRRLKGECHLHLKEYKKAVFEYKLVARRKFEADDPNYKWRKQAWYNYGLALLKMEDCAEALKAFDTAKAIDEGKTTFTEAELLLHHGLALQKNGKAGFEKDWKAAAKMGSTRAAELLEAMA